MSRPIASKVIAGTTGGGIGAIAGPLLAYYFEMPAEIAAAWSALLTWGLGVAAAYLTPESRYFP